MWIQHIISSNDGNGLSALLQQAEIDDIQHPWHVANMAQRLRPYTKTTTTTDNSTPAQPTIAIHVCVGEWDTMAPPSAAKKLCNSLMGYNDNDDSTTGSTTMNHDPDPIHFTMIPKVGHAVPMEAPRLWRSNVLDFLSS
jgi:pimeloyl-ACP methyl ester carboxylesterase